MSFPNGFLWGAASSSAQIEGAWDEGGRTPSIWDLAPKRKIRNGDNPLDGCDHFHRMKADVALMKEMGLKCYRFSISWPRVEPENGVFSEKGLGFYNDLVDELKSAGIEPVVTLYHWDLPLWAHKAGGWTKTSIVGLFTAYVSKVVSVLSDRVRFWIPLNEPQCFIGRGYLLGKHAPFSRKVFSLPSLTKNCLLAHKEAVDVIRREAKTPPLIGIAMCAGAYIPKDESEKEVEKARRKSFFKGLGAMGNRWWADPVFLGKGVKAYGMFRTKDEDMEKCRAGLDFIGLNVYQPYGRPLVPPERLTSNGWVIDGRVLYWTTRFFYERYSLPVMITENGMADRHSPGKDRKVHDEKRIRFLKEYLSWLSRASDEGIPLLGYLHWSIFDNFEWAEGFESRFGLVHIDYKTKERIPKDSAAFYKEIIASGGRDLPPPDSFFERKK